MSGDILDWEFSLFKSFFSLQVFPFFALAICFSSGVQATAVGHHLPNINLPQASATADTRKVAQWVTANADNQQLPFVVIDKKNAQAFVFTANGQLKGATTVLLGLAVGDDGLAGLSDREVSSLLPHQRTTPAGRFAAEPGLNLQGDNIIWLDYGAGLAIHRLRPDHQLERRARRIATASPLDNRVSLGCVIVPDAFYEKVIWPVLGKSRSVVYVLPETRPLQHMLNALQSSRYQ